MTEVQRYAELSGPAGSTVFVRPDFSKYIMEETGATSIVDWLDNHQVAGIPSGDDRLYAGLDIPAANRGIFARINAFTPRVEKGSMSVVELAVVCPATGPYTEMAGIMLTVDWANYQYPPKLDLNVEWWRKSGGVKVGSYGMTKDHFEPYDLRPADVGAPLDDAHISTPGGEQ
ncbi:MAG TPA: hypothetical protein PK156_26805 [Polyangium sp.]|nr:hypothetical protein [Polyangium sp.]